MAASPLCETMVAPAVSAPLVPLPRGACDTHMHVFGPLDRFPLPEPASYALPDADARRHLDVLDRLGLDHAVLVQPSPYGTDHRALLSALDHGEGRLRGIGSCAAATSGEDLQLLRDKGVVGLRFVEMRVASGARYPGTQGLDAFDALAGLMTACGMHAQLWADCGCALRMGRRIAALGMPLVLDHLAGLTANDRKGTESFDAIADLLQSGRVWVKLTYFRKSAMPQAYDDMQRVVTDLVEARPDRMLWASDWPFVKLAGPPPDAGALLDRLRAWLGEEAFRRVLRDNPAELFGFPSR